MSIINRRQESRGDAASRQWTKHFIMQLFPEAWHGEMSAVKAGKILDNQPIGTYFFREEDERVYLSGIDHHAQLQHVEFVREKEFWMAFQGGEYIAKNPKDLIPLSLHCEESVCAPLSP